MTIMTNKTTNTRELAPFYIPATDEDISQMMETVGVKNWDELFNHIDNNIKFKEVPDIGERLEYHELSKHLESIAAKNHLKTSFIGSGLKNYQVSPIVPYVSNIRNLTTAYTPYQPERSQGTLYTLWLYAQGLRSLTGFEAINASLYDRSTCLYEALNTATRLVKDSHIALVSETLYEGDIEVLKTLSEHTPLKIVTIKMNSQTGLTDLNDLKEKLQSYKGKIAALAYPQVNAFGNIEDVDILTNLAHEVGVQAIAVIDPILMIQGGLKAPIHFGAKGANMIVAEGQHLAIGPNFGGPGLGIFGIRYNESDKTSIRQTAGRYVGKTVDVNGNEALCMVLSTREQHIRREKATSNICSNQSFIATLAGASLLAKGGDGLKEAIKTARDNALYACRHLLKINNISLAFPTSHFYNEITFEIKNTDVDALIKKASCENDLHIGVNLSHRIMGDRNLLLISFFDTVTKVDIDKLINFFKKEFGEDDSRNDSLSPLPKEFMRHDNPKLPNFNLEDLKKLYQSLGNMNVSPDDNIYPLGSCTMKYNPHINDYAANLKGFTDIHPEAPIEDVEGALEILYQTQEIFKKITGLKGVVTQAVAGAQGELLGLKLFKAYHRNNGEGDLRKIILIPRSAHGTNPASAAMANYQIITLGIADKGQMDINEIKEVVQKYGSAIAGIMVTNPNTSGIFETQFREMSEIIHSVGGLVYMDGANMNAIASICDLDKLGVDAVHNNLHKTWSIPHGGGGPGDAIVAVSEKLMPYLPGVQVEKVDGKFITTKATKSIGSFHRHFGNFGHKVRCYTYIKALGSDGVKRMSSMAVLAARYLYQQLKNDYPSLPVNSEDVPRMHEFILTLSKEDFSCIEKAGTPKAQAIARVGKLFLDFGLHAPTVAFPEVFGLMIEPTESFTKKELDAFVEVVKSIKKILLENPEVLTTVPHFTPVGKVDEVLANKNLILSEDTIVLPNIQKNNKGNEINSKELSQMNPSDICEQIIRAHIKVHKEN